MNILIPAEVKAETDRRKCATEKQIRDAMTECWQQAIRKGII